MLLELLNAGLPDIYTVLVLIKLTKFAVALQLRCGSCKLICLRYFIIFSFKNVVHSLEPGETPSNSAAHQARNYVYHITDGPGVQKHSAGTSAISIFVSPLRFNNVVTNGAQMTSFVMTLL